MGRRAHSLRLRLQLRSQDGGFTLIEVVVALAILVLVLVALLGTISTLSVTQVANRTRTSGTTIGSDMIERARALTFTRLAVLDDGTVPSTYTVNGTPWPVVKGTPCPGCLPYKQTRTVRGVDYSITQLVLQRGQYTNADGNPVLAKQVVVDVTWTKPRPGKYSIQTIVNDTTPLTAPTIQGLRIEVHDDTDAIIEDDTVSWDVSISGPLTLTGSTDDGQWLNADLPVGTYQCTVATNDTTVGYHLAGHPGVRTVTQTCTVTANTVTVSTSQWTDSDECPVGTGTGGLTFNVKDASGNPLSAASVSLVRQSDGAAVPVSSTDATGAVTFAGLVDGRYSYSVSRSGYQSPVLGTTCNYAALTSSNLVSMVPAASPAPSPSASSTASPAPVTTATVNVTIVRKQKGAKDYVVRLHSSAGDIDRPINVGAGCTGTVTFSGVPFGTYNVLIYEKDPKGNLNQKNAWNGQGFTSSAATYQLTWTTGTDNSLVCA